jgi:hypothetical protein
MLVLPGICVDLHRYCFLGIPSPCRSFGKEFTLVVCNFFTGRWMWRGRGMRFWSTLPRGPTIRTAAHQVQGIGTNVQSYAHEVEPEQRFEAATSVSRLAVAGQAGMMALYNQIVDRNLDSGAFPLEHACTLRC